MNEKKRRVPKLRFPGFTDDWEQRKFSELYARSSEKNDGSIGIEKNITVASMQFKSDVKVTSESYLKTYYTFNVGDIAFEGHQSKDFRFGRFVENDIGNGIVSHIFVVFRPIEKNDLIFWKYLINNENVVGRILSRSTKASTMMHDLVAKDFLNEKISVPSLEEQRQIGSFFANLDNLITLHQRKLDHLKDEKKSLLQKMFPKKGEDFPELRFPGFTDAWEQRKLGEVFTERSERSGEGELISVTINSGVVKASELDRKDNSSDNKSNYKKVKVGDIAYNSMRMWQGASGYSLYDGILSPAYTVIIPRKNVESKFFAYDFKRHEMIQTFKRNSQGLTSDTWNLKFPTLKTVKVMVPSFNEQRKISAFFERLDYLITFHQRKLDHLQDLKKALLQSMFV
ncbi:MAG: hypothetical protein EUB_03342 [Eubacterium sp.]|uniref:restriction endonuclease subunit S n=1 Tax=Eubacterium sp. TaxID=142586 RepID=UPI003035E68C